MVIRIKIDKVCFCIDRLNKGEYNEADTPIKTSWFVGLFQAVAILPGLAFLVGFGIIQL